MDTDGFFFKKVHGYKVKEGDFGNFFSERHPSRNNESQDLKGWGLETWRK